LLRFVAYTNVLINLVRKLELPPLLTPNFKTMLQVAYLIILERSEVMKSYAFRCFITLLLCRILCRQLLQLLSKNYITLVCHGLCGH